VNVDTIGGVSGLTGASSFAPQTLNEISPPLLEHGHEQVLSILTEKKVIPDPIDPEASEVVVETIDELDGSKLVDLMNTLAQDQEWDQYLLGHVRGYLEENLFQEASELTNRIKNPVVRVAALGDLMVAYLQNEQPSKIKLLMARVRLDVDRIEDLDTKVFTINSEGAVDSNLSGRLQYCDSKFTLNVRGELFDNRVRLKMRSKDGEFFINDDLEEKPSHLEEALVVGFVRMGLLHNVIRFGGNLVPDHANGGVRNWVVVPVVGRNSNKMFFDIYLSI
tara:strand:- start:608 stop:1441 length:834 start_codon:yes stop_codon:yes gene_type:complete